MIRYYLLNIIDMEHLEEKYLPLFLSKKERRFDKMKNKTFVIKILNLIAIILLLITNLLLVIKKGT